MKTENGFKAYLHAAAMYALMAEQMWYPLGNLGGRVIKNGVHPVRHPWDGVELSKAERRGKSYEEVQALRQEKWEASKKEGEHEND